MERHAELAIEVVQVPNGVVMELWHGEELLGVHWGVSLAAAANCASASVAEYIAEEIAADDD